MDSRGTALQAATLRPLSVYCKRRGAYERARDEWPELRLSFEQFEQHLLALGHAGDQPREAGSLYLCLACALGLPAAHAALEALYFPWLRKELCCIDPDLADEMLQQVRSRLLVGPAPKIGLYRGEGSLASWLRAVALNVARDQLRADRAARARRTALASAVQEPGTAMRPWLEAPDELAFRAQRVQLCEQALTRAVGALSVAERSLLHNHFVLSLSIDVLGPMYGVNRATAARRIQRALRVLQRRFWRELELELGSLEQGEASELLRATARQLYCNVEDLLLHEPGAHGCSPGMFTSSP